MILAQLEEWLLPTPDDRGLNPVIIKNMNLLLTAEKTKIKKNMPGMIRFKNVCL